MLLVNNSDLYLIVIQMKIQVHGFDFNKILKGMFDHRR